MTPDSGCCIDVITPLRWAVTFPQTTTTSNHENLKRMNIIVIYWKPRIVTEGTSCPNNGVIPSTHQHWNQSPHRIYQRRLLLGDETLVGVVTDGVVGVVGVVTDGVVGEDGESSDFDFDFLEDLDLESLVFDFLEDFGVELDDDRNRALMTGLN